MTKKWFSAILCVILIIIWNEAGQGKEPGKKLPPSLLSEFQRSDAVLRVRVDEFMPVNLPAKGDWRKTVPPEAEIKGTVFSSFKGNLAKQGDSLTLDIHHAEYEKWIDEIRANYDLELPFIGTPSKGNNAVFLVRKTSRKQEINIIMRTDDDFVKRYTKISKAKPDAAAFLLTELISHYSFDSWDVNRTNVNAAMFDWNRLYSNLNRGSSIQKLFNKYHPKIVEGINRAAKKGWKNQDFNWEKIYYSVWLASLMPESQRKGVVSALMNFYGYLVRRTNEIKKNPPTRQNSRVPDSVRCIGAPEVEFMEVSSYLAEMPSFIEIVVSPSVVDRTQFLMVPTTSKKRTEEILKEAREFVN